MRYTIYTISCSASNEIIYIGVTKQHLNNRLSGHKSGIKVNNQPIYRYMREKSITPKIYAIEVIESGTLKEAILREKYWIDFYKNIGCNIQNRGFSKGVDNFVKQNTQFVRISNKAIKVAKRNKRKTGVPIGKFIENCILATEMTFNYTPMSREDVVAPKQKINIKYAP